MQNLKKYPEVSHYPTGSRRDGRPAVGWIMHCSTFSLLNDTWQVCKCSAVGCHGDGDAVVCATCWQDENYSHDLWAPSIDRAKFITIDRELQIICTEKKKITSSYLVDVRLMALKGRKLSLTTPMECWEVYRYSCRLLARPQLAFWKSPNQNPCPICRFAYTLNSANKWRNWTRFFLLNDYRIFLKENSKLFSYTSMYPSPIPTRESYSPIESNRLPSSRHTRCIHRLFNVVYKVVLHNFNFPTSIYLFCTTFH